MPLELVNTTASVVTAVVIASTAIAALIQLRHLRAGNQVNAMISIGNQFDEKSFRDAASAVRSCGAAMDDAAFREYDYALRKRRSIPSVRQEYVDLRQAVLLVGNTFEELGILVKNDVIDRDMFLDRYALIIADNWTALAPYAAWVRKVYGTAHIWENFEYLTVIAVDFHRRRPSTYPRGVRRLPLPDAAPLPNPEGERS